MPRKLLACHKCDNRLCVNPTHIFWGTNKDNMQDALNKGRLNRKTWSGKAWKSKLSKDEAISVIRLAAAGYTKVSIAKNFGITEASIRQILLGKTWNTEEINLVRHECGFGTNATKVPESED
jgi:hypothetical protein